MDEPVMEAPSVGAVRALLREQAPDWADQPLSPAAGSGSSNWVFRLGETHAVRLPRSDEYADDLRKETQWLPVLGPKLTTPVPVVDFSGEASVSFPRPWAIVTWLPGTPPQCLDPSDQRRLASSLGSFIADLHSLPTDELEGGAARWGYRSGSPVTPTMDRWAERAAEALSDLFEPGAVAEAWRRLRSTPLHQGPPVWVHTDLSGENVLVDAEGSLTGVIDFGGLGIGDPAVDLLYAWGLFDAPAREVFRASAGVDEVAWLRAGAWGFVGPGLLTLANYRASMPGRAARLTAMVEGIAREVGVELR